MELKTQLSTQCKSTTYKGLNSVRKYSNSCVDDGLLTQTSLCFCVCSTSLLKTLREKAKLLLRNNFSLNQCFFFFFKPFTTQSQLLKILIKKPFEHIVGKGENADKQHFLLFLHVFYPSQKFHFSSSIILSSANAFNLNQFKNFSFGKELKNTSSYFYQVHNCHLQTLSVWNSLKFVVWERVNRQLIKALVSGRKIKSWQFFLLYTLFLQTK